jgi:predicted GIY-YIG superfamily endonuclease
MRGAMDRPFFAYILQCADGSYYVGHTDDLEKRLAEHREGGKCTYTETRRPVQLAWSQEFATRAEALAAELQIKNWNRAKKQALARGDFGELHRAAKKKAWAAYRQRRQLP